jgi:hypothetical protein
MTLPMSQSREPIRKGATQLDNACCPATFMLRYQKFARDSACAAGSAYVVEAEHAPTRHTHYDAVIH